MDAELWTPSRELLQGSEEAMEPPPDDEEAALHGRVARRTESIASIHVEDGGAPCGKERALVGKAHNKRTELKELGVLCPHIRESDRGLQKGDKGINFRLCKRGVVDAGPAL